MVGETKDPSNPKEVAASIFAAVAVYAVRIFLWIFLDTSIPSFGLSTTRYFAKGAGGEDEGGNRKLASKYTRRD
jgi:hypothetical protein